MGMVKREVVMILLVITAWIAFCNADYTLEIRAVRYEGKNKRDHNGDCCDVGFFSCDECDVDFHFCVRDKGTSALSTTCWYSAETSDDKANAGSINFPTTGELYGGAGLNNPITFSRGGSWPGSFQLMVRITDSDGSTSDDLVDRVTFDRDLSPSSSWTDVISGNSYYNRASFTAQFRVRCNSNYYTSSCSVYCKPTDNSNGHYDCNSLGQKVCKSGWSDPGNYCLTPICSSGCSETGGYCNVPSECICNSGWTGSLCNQCIPKEGCSTDHGHCEGPFTCVCETGYGGTLCDQDADVCGHQAPCKHDASCTNTGLDSYSCDCLPGYTGTNCEININDCDPNPCVHGGSCIDQVNGYYCDCLVGYTGENCEVNINDCSPNPCQNSAACKDLIDDFQCDCLTGFVGTLCEGHECDSDPCQNNGTCYQNTTIGYHCDCIKGYTGDHCQSDIDECDTIECENGGTCQNNPGSYQCICSNGFTGSNCSINIDDCLNNSCSLDSVCVDDIDSYSCVCDLGYTGQYCNDRIDYCHIEEGGAAACFNNGTCNNYIGYYGCNCPEGFNGSRCEINIDDCSPNSCENRGNCTDEVNGFICTCAAGYTGLTCNTTIDYCDPNPCDINEECVVQPSFVVNEDSSTRNYHCLVCIENICEDPEAVIDQPVSTMIPYQSPSPSLEPIINDNVDRYTIGMIAGVVVGGAVLACCLFWLFIACCCYCKRKNEPHEELYSISAFEGPNEVKENPLFLSPRDLLSSNSFRSKSSSFGRSRKPSNPIYDSPNETRLASSETPADCNASKSTTGTVWYHKLLNPLYKSIVPSSTSSRSMSPTMHGYAVLQHHDSSSGQGDNSLYGSIKDPTCDPDISGTYTKLDDMADTKHSRSLHHATDNPYIVNEPLPPPLTTSVNEKQVPLNDLPTDNTAIYETIAPAPPTYCAHSESN